jgi:hypothetical protein
MLSQKLTKRTSFYKTTAGLLVLTGAISIARCAESSSDPLLDLLIQKGMITQEEAKRVQAEAEALRSNAPALPPEESKWKISKAFKNIELFGDLRFRFEDRTAHDPNEGSIDLQRYRYALRVGLRGEALDNVYYGFRLDTAQNPRSPWVTFGTSASGTPYQGPFGKSTSGVDVGQIYLGWRGLDWLELTVGKMPNPIYTTPMVWDTDYNPEGMAEKLKYTLGHADFFATFGQFLYQDVNPAQADSGYFNIDYPSANMPFLLAWQAGLTYHFTKDLDLKVAPVLYNYSGHGVNSAAGITSIPDFSGTFVGQGSTNGVNGVPAFYQQGGNFDGFVANQTGINDLMIIDVPFQLDYRYKWLNLRVFGDYAENLQGSDRAKAAFAGQNSTLLADVGLQRIPSAQTHDVKAYQAGIAIGNKDSLGLVYGSTSRKHAWELRSYWQHVEQYALDPNLLDSDFFEGRGNLEGIYTALAYGLTDNVIATVRYGYAHRINEELGTGGSNQDIPQMNPIEHYNILQLDLTLRF